MSAKAKPVLKGIPTTWQEADAMVTEFGETTSTIVTLEAGCEAAIAKVKAEYADKIAPLQKRMDEIVDLVNAWAENNRATITDDGKRKSVEMSAATIGWRNNRPSVRWASGVKADDILRTIDALIKHTKERGVRATLKQFIRTSREPNKDAMLANTTIAMMVSGVRIRAGVEMFYIDPTQNLPEPK